MPVWSPDGSKIYFTTGARKISVIPADRSKPAEVLFEVPSPQRLHATSITPDGIGASRGTLHDLRGPVARAHTSLYVTAR